MWSVSWQLLQEKFFQSRFTGEGGDATRRLCQLLQCFYARSFFGPNCLLWYVGECKLPRVKVCPLKVEVISHSVRSARVNLLSSHTLNLYTLWILCLLATYINCKVRFTGMKVLTASLWQTTSIRLERIIGKITASATMESAFYKLLSHFIFCSVLLKS